MKRPQKSFLKIFIEGITNIFSFKGYARKRNSNYFRKRKNPY